MLGPAPQTVGGHDERRNALRATVRISADLRRPGRTPFQVKVCDISLTGCQIETVARVNSGEQIWLTLPGIAPIEGIIRWVSHSGLGCQWVRPIYPAVFDHIRQRFPDSLA